MRRPNSDLMDELRKSELRYRALFDSANDAIFVVHQDLIAECNAKALQVFGGTSQQLVGKSFADLSPSLQPDGQSSREKAFDMVRLALAGESVVFDWKCCRVDGTLFDAEVSLKSVEIGGELMLELLVRDISERKRAQEALAERNCAECALSEERFRKAFRLSPIPMVIAKVYGGIVDVNDIALQKFGLTLSEVLGLTTDDLGISIEPAARLREEFFKGGMKIRNRETRYQTHSGQVLTVLVSAELIQMNGEPHILWMAPDITAQKLHEDSMRILSSAVTTASDAIIITDNDLSPTPTVLYVNPAFTQLTGYTSEELVGRRTSDTFGTRVDSSIASEIRQTLLTENAFHGEVINYTKDGRTLYLELDITPVRDPSGEITNFVAIRRDISRRHMETLNRKRLLRLILEAQAAEQRRISRELHDHAGQLLTSMLLRLEALQLAATSPSVKRAVREISSVASSTLEELSRLARGLHPAVLDDLGLVEALRRAMEEFEGAGISAQLLVDGIESRLLQNVEHEIYQIVKEALTNVRKHSKARHVVLSLEQRGAFITASIADDGVGFDYPAGTTGQAGLGIVGMNERAALLGGSINVRSSPNDGTVVTVTVPLKTPLELAVGQ